MPWISLAILLIPIGVILRAGRVGELDEELRSGRAIALVLVALLAAWFLRKR